jgi:hypothetical protein
MDFNFFQWVREGVRRSVLLGVSDAIHEIGTPHDDDEVAKRMFGRFQAGPASPPLVEESGNRKRLGRSLKSVQAAEKKAA